MQNIKKIIILFLSLMVFVSIAPINAAKVEDLDEFSKTKYRDTLSVEGLPTINFIKDDGSIIDWINPISVDDTYDFGMLARFNLDNIDEIINQVSEGNISGMPSAVSAFVEQYKRQAVIKGSLDIKIDINEGLGDYFSVNQAVLDVIKTDPNSLFNNNAEYQEVFDIYDVSENNNEITISIQLKANVTGGKLLDLKDKFKTLDFAFYDLFTLNEALWNDIDYLNRGQFDELVKVSVKDTVFIVNIPKDLEGLAGLVGMKNPFVGIKLNVKENYGSLNLGFVVVYEGNGNDTGLAPVDIKSPYADTHLVKVLGNNSLAKQDHTFIGWSTDQVMDDNSLLFKENDTFNISLNTVLYAQWKHNSEIPVVPESEVYSATAKYVDDKGNKISDDYSVSGLNGDSYLLVEKVISGYTLKEVKGNREGVFLNEHIKVEFIYEKNIVEDPKTVKTGLHDNSASLVLLMLASTGMLLLINKRKSKNSI